MGKGEEMTYEERHEVRIINLASQMYWFALGKSFRRSDFHEACRKVAEQSIDVVAREIARDKRLNEDEEWRD